ncbi:alpha-ketoglutarate-dependent dioxygenase alkB homolog 7, mitochondrial [Sabethes cyaneus]|uniref:alpha-ketoglutarate-dependent dioxygenase alkB homolog 7, mitochondrial n=1 Tax=Sabethes cyaneus TaxID=53552 RepID=UPI00237EB404|nr:alpha-ketoglutarate-dependent dioxygenase alkB homolog 7, mitochondrial [Sabethes cyaneus]
MFGKILQNRLLLKLAFKNRATASGSRYVFGKCYYTTDFRPTSTTAKEHLQPNVTFHGVWPADDQCRFLTDMTVITDFITEREEQTMLEELEPVLKRIRYELDHWDDAIHGYRETERKHWFPANRLILDRVKDVAFEGETLPYVHVLDLTKEGVIKPHVDSVRFCGSTIAGISLLTDSVMRLVRTNDEEQTNEDYRQIFASSREDKFWADVLLSRRSLYIMKDFTRYKFTHEILVGDESVFKDRKVEKDRRVSIICRNEA